MHDDIITDKHTDHQNDNHKPEKRKNEKKQPIWLLNDTQVTAIS